MRALVVAFVVAIGGVARADGGPAMSLQVHFSDDPHLLFVVTNYGPIISRDDGCTFHWICEPNVGYGGAYIPQFAMARDGAIFATSFGGLRVSRDGGCSFSTIAGGLPAQIAVAAVALGPTGEVWAGTAQGGMTNDVYVSRDNGVTFAARGLASPSIVWRSIRVAPGDPARVYAAGTEQPAIAHLRRSEGAGWVTSPLTGIVLGPGANLVVAAVDPVDRDVVYVVSEDAGRDRLYRSADGGMTFVEVFAPAAYLRDVVIHKGQVIATTMVVKGMTVVASTAYVSKDGGRTFAPFEGAPTLACLGVSPSGALVGCSANWDPDFKAVTRLDGDVWTKVWRFVEMAGPLACPQGTGGFDICEPAYRGILLNLMPSGPVCGPFAPDAGVEEKPKPPDTCCSVGGGPNLGLALAIAWWLRRRRPRSLRG